MQLLYLTRGSSFHGLLTLTLPLFTGACRATTIALAIACFVYIAAEPDLTTVPSYVFLMVMGILIMCSEGVMGALDVTRALGGLRYYYSTSGGLWKARIYLSMSAFTHAVRPYSPTCVTLVVCSLLAWRLTAKGSPTTCKNLKPAATRW